MFLVLSFSRAVGKLKSPCSHRNVSEFITFLLPDNQQTLFPQKMFPEMGKQGDIDRKHNFSDVTKA